MEAQVHGMRRLHYLLFILFLHIRLFHPLYERPPPPTLLWRSSSMWVDWEWPWPQTGSSTRRGGGGGGSGARAGNLKEGEGSVASEVHSRATWHAHKGSLHTTQGGKRERAREREETATAQRERSSYPYTPPKE